MSTMWIDATGGVSGDALLAALVDAGAEPTGLQAAVDAVLPGAVRLRAGETHRGGVPVTTVALEARRADGPGDAGREDPERALEQADLDDRVRRRALVALTRLASVTPAAAGPQDAPQRADRRPAVAQAIAVSAALVALDVGTVVLSPVGLGPSPAPTVLRLAGGWDVLPGGPGARTTATGLALVTSLADRPGPLPSMRVRTSGVGAAGEEDDGGALQVVLGDEAPRPTPGTAHAVVVEANVDDLDPRLWPDVVAALLASGASDAWLTPILMKKGRPAHTVHVLCPPDLVEAVGDVLWRHTTTLGWRATPVIKHVLDRTWVEVATAAGPVRVKLGLRDGRVVQAMPEYEDVRRAAADADVPVREVLADAHAAADRAGLRRGAPAP